VWGRNRAIWIYISLIAVLGVFIYLPASAQDDEFCGSPPKKARKYFAEAEKVGFRGDDAYYLLKKALIEDEEFAEAYLELGHINYRKFKSSIQSRGNLAKISINYENRFIEYYLQAMEYCPEIEGYRLNYLLGEHYYFKKDYGSAKAFLLNYISHMIPDKKNQLKSRAEEYVANIDKYNHIINNPVPFEPVKVGGVSTEDDEYLPMLSPDNRYLFFTRKSMVKRGSTDRMEREMFVRSGNNYNGTFEHGIPMPYPFNQKIHQGGSSVSVDNKLIFITLIEMVNVDGIGYPMGDIYYSEFKYGEWNELKSLGPNINSRKVWEGQPSISADNKTLYFSRAINKIIPGEHYGLMDLYKTERNPDGTWGDPINLGPEINTSGNEKTPFIHSDSYTLYFSSDKHIGVGRFDIFYSKMEDDGSFKHVNNLGYPINTENDEHGFIVSTDGRFGYFSSSLDDDNLDIYSFDLYLEARPENVVFVKGSAISNGNIEGLEIKLKNVVTEKEIGAVLDEETGEYVGVIAVKENEDVLMTAKKDGYAFTSQYISSDENVIGKPVKKELEIKKIKKGESYQINNIEFATNSYDLNNKVKAILDEFGGFLFRNQNLIVELHGHTDNVGNDLDNQVLSDNRAKAVSQYLIDNGVDPKRLFHKGFGPFKPIADNNTEEGRAKNRRTEFLVVSK